MIQHCYLCNTAQFCALQHNKLVIAWTVCMCCMSNKALGVGSRGTIQTRLCLVLYGPLDPTLCPLLLSCPCFNSYLWHGSVLQLYYATSPQLTSCNWRMCKTLKKKKTTQPWPYHPTTLKSVLHDCTLWCEECPGSTDYLCCTI